MVDYNLHGMSFINVSQVKYRPNPKYPDQLKTLPKDKILPTSLQRRSVCELEMDCFACDIINMEEILSGKLGTNPGIAALWEDEKQRRRDKQQDSQVSFCLSQERNSNPEPTTTHEFFAQRLVDKLSTCDKNSGDTSCSELDNSVYPAETPDDLDYLITPANITTSAANSSMFDDTLIPDSQNVPVFSQTDKNLLEILKELKENVHIEDDSVLSQQNPSEPNVDGCLGNEADEDDDEEDVMLSLPLNKALGLPDVDAEADADAEDDDVWNDTFWDENCAFPQVDGTQDITSANSELNQFMDDLLESGISEAEMTSESSSAGTNQECRYANEVFIGQKSSVLSTDQQLNPGSNTLLTTEPQNAISDKSRVKILSDLVVKPDCNVKVSWQLFTTHSQLQLQLNIEKKELDDAFVDPLPFADDGIDFENDLDDFDINEIILNDVNMGNLTPTLADDTLLEQLSPKTPHAHANQCSCRQSPCNSGNRLFGEDCMNLFNDRLYENNLPSSGDKENVATNAQKCQKNTLNAVKRNLKSFLVGNKKNVDKKVKKETNKSVNKVEQSLKYNLRSLENTPKEKKCCKLCTDNAIVGCSSKPETVKKELPKETETKVKKPQLKLKEMLSKLEIKRKTSTTNTDTNTNNKEKILVQIPLSKIFRRGRGRPKKVLQQIDAASTTSSEDIADLKINEKNNNKIITAENELINIPVKKRGNPRKMLHSSESETTESISATSTTESEDLSSGAEIPLSSAEICIKKLNKLKLMNWNLDGQNDTPSSDSEHSQKNGIPEDNYPNNPASVAVDAVAMATTAKLTRTRSSANNSNNKRTPKFRVSGLAKKSNKSKNADTLNLDKTERTTRNSLQKKKLDQNITNPAQQNEVNHKVQEQVLLKNEELTINNEIVTQNGSFTSPRLLRNRKVNIDLNAEMKNDAVSISPKILRKRKSESEANNTMNSDNAKGSICSSEMLTKNADNFETQNDEFKENKIELSPLKVNQINDFVIGKKEKKTRLVETSNRPVLRNKSRYSEAERNLKRQKRLSLSLKHLREKQEGISAAEGDNEVVKKELRVSLMQMPFDKLTKNSTNKIKDLKVILEPLRPEILEKYSNRIVSAESSPQLMKEGTEVCVENGKQRITRNSMKETTSLCYQSPELGRRETRSSLKPVEIKTEPSTSLVEDVPEVVKPPEIESKRVTRQSSNHQESNQIVDNSGKQITSAEVESNKRVTRQTSTSNVSSSDSCEDVPEPIIESIIKKLNTTPTKKSKISSPSPKKYSPLNVIKSPRIKPLNVENQTTMATTIEPLKKRLRNFDSSELFAWRNELFKR